MILARGIFFLALDVIVQGVRALTFSSSATMANRLVQGTRKYT